MAEKISHTSSIPKPIVQFTQGGTQIPTMLLLNDAAKVTGLTYSCLRRWILSGEFQYYVKAGNRYLVNMDRLAEFLNKAAR